jgi:hypothetical protein
MAKMGCKDIGAFVDTIEANSKIPGLYVDSSSTDLGEDDQKSAAHDPAKYRFTALYTLTRKDQNAIKVLAFYKTGEMALESKEEIKVVVAGTLTYIANKLAKKGINTTHQETRLQINSE